MVGAADRRKAWVRAFVRRAPEVPLYGSEAWLAMPEGLDKWVAVLRYAEAARTALEDELARLRQEHLSAALTAKRAEDAAYVQSRDQWRRDYSQTSWRPHPANRGEVA